MRNYVGIVNQPVCLRSLLCVPEAKRSIANSRLPKSVDLVYFTVQCYEVSRRQNGQGPSKTVSSYHDSGASVHSCIFLYQTVHIVLDYIEGLIEA